MLTPYRRHTPPCRYYPKEGQRTLHCFHPLLLPHLG